MTDFADLMMLERTESNRFVGRHSQVNRNGAVFGGQLLAQLARTAELTVSESSRLLHTLQVTFEQPAISELPIEYLIESAFDGGSEAIRQVRGMQQNRVLVRGSANFGSRFGGFEHREILRDSPRRPECLPSLRDSAAALEGLLTVHGKSRARTYPQVEIRPLEPRSHLLVDPGRAISRFWIRLLSDRPSGDWSDSVAIAFLSDYLAVNAALVRHVTELPPEPLFVATLTHSLWIHAAVDTGRWIFCEWNSPWAGGGRALCLGKFFDEEGSLVATAGQVVMVRQRKK